MAVLKDMRCKRCGTVREEMANASTSMLYLDCAKCKRSVVHTQVFLPGLPAVVQVTASNLYDFIGTVGVGAGIPRPEDIGTPRESANAEPVRRKDGRIVQAEQRFTDGLAEHRDKRQWEYHRKLRGPRLFADQRRSR